MLDLLVELALAERDSKNAVVSFFCQWDLVCRPRVPSEDRGNWSWRLSLVCLVMSMRYIFDIDWTDARKFGNDVIFLEWKPLIFV